MAFTAALLSRRLATYVSATHGARLTSLPITFQQNVPVPPSAVQVRSVWQEVIRQVPSQDPNRAGELTFEDPELADMRMRRAEMAEAPLRKRMKFIRHEKEWMKRKRLKAERRYNNLERGIEELKLYIKFMEENKRDK